MSNIGLVQYLVETGRLKSPEVIRAFRKCDRQYFVPPDKSELAYTDHPLPIGFGQTISQPTTVAIMLELLDAKEGHQVLDIGSGSGWTTALLGEIVGPAGSVTGLERIEQLVQFGQFNLDNCNLNQCRILKAGPNLGLPGQKFDRILVSAAAESLPKELVDQLKPDGKMVVPVNDTIICIRKTGDKIAQEIIPGFVFVPLIKD